MGIIAKFLISWTVAFNYRTRSVFIEIDIASGMKRWYNRPMPDCNSNRQIFFY